MSANRVQKLLFSEYCDFDDMVLVESPFAQTTKDGTGVRQVHIGLTPSKLILAADILPPVQIDNTNYSPVVDPEIETFELIAIYPVECVTLTIYRRKKRQALKARFCNSRVLYFELGGFEKRSMFWNLWCEKVKFLCPGESDYSRSETSVGTSTTESSLYLVNKKTVLVNGIRQLWCRFGPNLGINTSYINNVLLHNSQNLATKWTDKNLFLGKDYQESPLSYKPIVKLPSKERHFKKRHTNRGKWSKHPSLMEEKKLSYGDNVQVNRFGSGINEGCETGLYLTVDKYIVPKKYDETRLEQSLSVVSSGSCSKYMDYDRLAESALLTWEYSTFKKRSTVKHRRRYGFAPMPLILFGLGLQDAAQSQLSLIQARRTCSEICLKLTSMKLYIPKRQLLSTISCPDLREVADSTTTKYIKTIKNPIYFWTWGYSYRPTSAKDIYFNLQTFLRKCRYSRASKSKRKILCLGRKCNNRRSIKTRKMDKQTDEDDDDDGHFFYRKSTKYSFLVNMLTPRIEDGKAFDNNARRPDESPVQHLKRLLRLDTTTSAWDFDSTTLAEQLTIIDRDLFLKIPSSELQMIMQQRRLDNAPNMAALIAFSFRITCLVATEILRNHSEKVTNLSLLYRFSWLHQLLQIRARLIARFINVANKCHRMSNFQSSRSVLSALQSPAIFRLRKTWAYIRKKHSSKYQYC